MPITVTIKLDDVHRDDKDRSVKHVRDQLLEAIRLPNMVTLLAAIMPVPAAFANLTRGEFLLFHQPAHHSGQPEQGVKHPTGRVTVTREN